MRSIVITGASSGIGAACALHLDAQGMKVFAGVRSEAAAERIAEAASPSLVPLRLDVTKQGTITRAAAQVAKQVGDAGLDALVNNAGIVVAGPLEYLPAAALREQLEVNVVGQVAVTQAFLPLLRGARGRIVNIGSVSGRLSTPFMGPYAASKFALAALTDALRMELRPWGIAVSLVEPGAVATPIWEKSREEAERLGEAYPGEAQERYGETMERMRELVAKTEQRASDPDKVVRAVHHAITAKRPRTRYLIGSDAMVQAQAAQWLPDRVRDSVILKFIGVKDPPPPY